MNNSLPSKFNIRVYGLFLNEKDEVLVTDEFQLNTKMTKFPGGGLDFGEGTIDCLRREIMEECNQKITDIRHFYTTDFYQKALFFDDQQVISIYYTVRIEGPVMFKISDRPFDFELKNGGQSFRWVAIKNINPEEFTFPIDKHVAILLKQKYRQ